MGPFQIKQVLRQGTFLLSDLSGNVFPKPINGFRLKPFFGENPLKEEVGVRLILLVGQKIKHINQTSQGHGESYSESNLLQVKEWERFDSLTRGVSHRSCMERGYQHFSLSEKELANTFMEMARHKMGVRRSPRMKEQTFKEDSSYVPSEEEDTTSVEEIMQRPTFTQEETASSSLFMDSKVILDLNNSKNRVWLQTMGLLEYASLPWESWRGNVQAKIQFKFFQNTDGFIAPGVFLSEEVVSYVFNLPMEGDTKFDRVPVKALEQEFGIPDNARGYYVVKKVKMQTKKHSSSGFWRMCYFWSSRNICLIRTMLTSMLQRKRKE